MEGKTKTVPAPVGGLNARDALADMGPKDAYVMDNADPNTTAVGLRLGSQNWATGLPGAVETLMPYSSPVGVNKLFAASGGNIYDVTSTGAVGAALVTGNTSNRWVYQQITTPGGTFLMAVNGTDYAQVYNGTTWQQLTSSSTPLSLTGVPTNQLSYVTLWKQRMFFAQVNSLGFWYLATTSIAGSASYFDLSAQFSLGGYLVAIVPWSAGQASNPQEYLAFISSNGEIVVYQGFDPSQAGGLFSLAMRFRVGTPVGTRPVTRYGDDVAIVSTDGLFLLSQAQTTNEADPTQALSYKIEQSINNDANTYGSNFGWAVTYWPQGSKLIVNVPTVTNSQSYQYVYNTISKAWSRYTGWNANCFEVFKNQVYWGGNGFVALGWSGNSDFGQPIIADVRQAYSYFDDPGMNKQFTLVRPAFGADDTFSTVYTLNTNFNESQQAYSLTYQPITGKSLWNVAPWNTSYWTPGLQTYNRYGAVSGIGYAGTVRMQFASQKANVVWYSTTYLYKPAGPI